MKTPHQLRQWVRDRQEASYLLRKLAEMERLQEETEEAVRNGVHDAMRDYFKRNSACATKPIGPQNTAFGSLKSDHIMIASVCIAVLGIAFIISGALA
jgi:hypothetical protein